MGKPKKRTSPRKTGTRRSHLVLKLARKVNGKSPVKVRTTKRESAKARSRQPPNKEFNNMASNRHLGRIIALQTLYEQELRQDADDTGFEISEVLERNIARYKEMVDDVDFIK